MLARHHLVGLVLALGAGTGSPAQTPPPPGPVESPFLGVQTELKDPRDAKGGVVISYLWPQSAAREMGLEIGDEIRTLNDVLITDPETFSREVRKENVNAKLRFRIIRAGKEMKIEGRIGSREKTMKAYQEQARKTMVGKPLPALPGLLWWNAATKAWEEKKEAESPWNALKGKIGVVMSFDDCSVCKSSRYLKLSQMQTFLSRTPGGDRVAYAGIFFDDRPDKSGKEKNLSTATQLVTASPPAVPIAVAYYPSGKPTPADRDTQVLIHNHGTAILNPSGSVEFLQVVGIPEQDFTAVLQKLLLAEAEKAKGGGKPAEPTVPAEPKKP